MCNISGQPGVVILLRRERGITMTGCEVISRESPFLQTMTTRAKEFSSQP
jgi:hypothetical protein